MDHLINGETIQIDGEAALEFEALRSSVTGWTASSASKLGLKRAFDELGMWPQVKAALASNEDAQEEWDLATEIRKTDPIVQGFIALFDLSEEQVDNLLIRAAALVA